MRPKGRPKKHRIICSRPRTNQFSPRGKPGRPDEANLAIDECEALRLVDFRGLPQIEAAKSMGVSQQTLSRILKRARRTVADAIVNGKIIRIKDNNE